jgi:hypothetical protein
MFAGLVVRQFGDKKDTSRFMVLVWFCLRNAEMKPAGKGVGISETPH